MSYLVAGQLDKSLLLLEETLKLRKEKFGLDHSSTLQVMNNLGIVYSAAKQGEKASITFNDYITAQRKQFSKDDHRFAGMLSQVSLELLKCEQFTTAEKMLRESLAIREKKEADAWTTFYTNSLLGGALLGQKKYADAEPLLLKGYEGMKAREKKIPPQGSTRIPEALDHLIQFYTETNKPDEVKKYRELREKYPAAKSAASPG